jgi:hypothetical protein
MVEKFNPAPLDKHPEDPKEAAKADREMDGNFMAGLVGTFPASDPVSATQPSPGPRGSAIASLPRLTLVSANRLEASVQGSWTS